MKTSLLKAAACVSVATVLLTAAFGCSKKTGPKGASSAASSQTNIFENPGANDASSALSSAVASAVSAATGSSSKTTSTATKPTQTGPFQEPVYDLKGRTIVIATSDPEAPKANTITYNSFKQTEQKFNCKFTYKLGIDYETLHDQLIKDHMTGTSTYDVAIMRGYDVTPALSGTGSLLALNKYYDFTNDPTWQPAPVKNIGWFAGNKYGLYGGIQEPGYAIWYNKTLLRNANVPDLWTYVDNNTWNWDTFRDVCKKLTKKDPGGNARNNQWAFTSEDPFVAFIFSNGGSIVNLNTSDGKPKIALDSQNSLQAIQLVTDMEAIDDTIPDGAELGQITDKPFNAMFTGKVAMFPYKIQYGAVLIAQGMKATDIGWVYMPKGPMAKDYILNSATQPPMFVVPANAKDPQKLVAALQDAVGYWSTGKASPVAIEEGFNDYVNDPNMKSYIAADSNIKRLLYEGGAKTQFDYVANFQLSKLQTELWPKILSQETTVKVAVAAEKNKLQTDVNNACAGSLS